MPITSSPRMRSLAGLCLLALPLSMPSLSQARPRPAQACLTAPAEADFGSAVVGDTGTFEVTLRNGCRRSVTVQALTASPAAFGVAGTGPIAIPARGSAAVTLRFAPADTGSLQGTLRIRVGHGGSDLSVALRGSGVPASARSGNLEVSPARIDESLPQGHSVGKVITLTNHGSTPMPVSIETWVKAPGAGPDSVGPRVSICIFSTMLDDGIENSFSWLLHSLPKVSGVDIRSGRYATPSLDDLLPYDMVVVTSYNSWADPDSAGNLLADYVDRGGTVVLMHRALDTTPLGAFALKGRIVGPAYSPVAPSPFDQTAIQIDTRNFIDHPLVQSVQWMETWTAQRAALQGKGVALGYNVQDDVAAAYNPDVPVFYINLNPYEPDYGGGLSLGQLFLNIIDRMQGTYNWLKNPVPNNDVVFTLAPGETRRMILPVGHSYALPVGTHYGRVFIYSNYPQQLTIPATLRVGAR